MSLKYHLNYHWIPITDDDDDDDDEEEETVQQDVVQQAAQPAQPAQSPISSDSQAIITPDEAVADNVDDVTLNNEIIAESGAKDPQQAALDQAATINNSINPVGEEAIVDDEDDDGM